jgi:hypothetical protein
LAAEICISRNLEAQSEHLHVHLPDGVEVAGLPQVDLTEPMAEPVGQSPIESQAGREVFGLINWDAAAIYRTSRISGDYKLVVPVLPRLEDFAWRAMTALLATAVPIALLLVASIAKKNLLAAEGSLSEQTISSLVLFAASLISGYAATDDKHYARARMLQPLRRAITMGVIAGIVATGWVLVQVVLLGADSLRWLDIALWSAAVAVELLAIVCVWVAIRTSTRVRSTLETVRGQTAPLRIVAARG